MSKYLFRRKFKVKRNKEIEPQEIFLDKLAEKKQEEIGVRENKFEIPLSRHMILGIFLLFLVFILFLIIQTAYLQILRADEFSALAAKNKFAMSFIKAERGVVYDSKGNQLVFNSPSFDLVVNKDELGLSEDRKKDILRQISDIINVSPEDMDKKIAEGEGVVTIAENINHDSLVILHTKIIDVPGLEIKNNSIRHYPDPLYFSHLLGYTGKTENDYTGKEGLEKSYETTLKENPGLIKSERDVYGNFLSKELVSEPESGNSLVLWLDADLQKKAADELSKILEKTGAKKGAIAIMDPKTGGILSLISLPSYDNNLFTRGADQSELNKVLNDANQPLFNRAVAGLYPSGSTIKPILSAAALEENLINPNKDLACQGFISVPNKYNSDIVYTYKDNAIHGPTNMRKAIAESCNVYFFTIGGGYGNQKGLGPARIKKYLELFGWGNKTGINLPGETEGRIPTPDWKQNSKNQPWTDGDTYNISIGQGDLLITPIQVVSSFAAIANGGTLYKPQLVKEIVNKDKEVLQRIEPEVIRSDFVSPESLKVSREGMRMAVTAQGAPQASSYSLNFLPVSAAAKTGTAETSKKNIYHNWVSVFAPYENPEIVVTVMIENVPGVQAAALPVAKGILEWYFAK